MYLNNPDPSIKSASWLFSGDGATMFLAANEHISDGWNAYVEKIRYKPGNKCLVSYRLVGPERQMTRIHLVGFSDSEYRARRKKLQARVPSHRLHDDECCAVFPFPTDLQLPALEKLSRGPASVLNRALYENVSHPDNPLGVQWLAYKAQRRVTAKITSASNSPVVLKLYDESSFESALQAARLLRRSGFAKAPERIGRSNRHRALVFRWLPGNSIDFLESSFSDLAELAAGIDRFLHQLQSTVAPSAFESTADEMTQIRALLGYMHLILPTAHRQIRDVGVAMERNDPNLKKSVLVHGDFHQGQVVRTDEQISVCDFDQCQIGDPLEDWANLMAHVLFQATVRGMEPAVVDELESEVAPGRLKSKNDQDRFLWLLAARMIWLAPHFFRSGRLDWQMLTRKWLEQILAKIRPIGISQVAVGRSVSPKNESTANGDQPTDATSMTLLAADPKLNFLVPALDPTTATKTFQRNLRQQDQTSGEYSDYTVTTVDVLRHKPERRCLLKFTCQNSRGTSTFLGKASAKRLDRRTFHLQSSLYYEHDFNSERGADFVVPKPLGLIPEWRLWLQQYVAGESGGCLLASGRIGDIVAQVASALAKLHQTKLETGRQQSVRRELEILDSRICQTSQRWPELESRLTRVSNRCHIISRGIRDQRPALLHRDFYHDQFLSLPGGRIALVDLDLLANGPAALDIGNFLAHLTEDAIRHHGNQNHYADAEERFCESYRKANPAVEFPDIQIFKTLSLARLVTVNTTIRERQHSLEKLLAVTEQRLLTPRSICI